MQELILTFWIVFSFSLCAGAFIETVVKERFFKNRQYLNVFGCKQVSYWVGNFIFDLSTYIPLMLVFIGIGVCMGLPMFADNKAEISTLFLCFGCGHILFSYAVSFLFTDSQMALKLISFLYLLGGLFLPAVILAIIRVTYGCMAFRIGEIINFIIPIRALYSGLDGLINQDNSLLAQMQKKMRERSENYSELPEPEKCDPLLSTPTEYIVLLTIVSILLCHVIYFTERLKVYFYKHPEEYLNCSLPNPESALSARDLCKIYNNKVQAVKGISFDLPKN